MALFKRSHWAGWARDWGLAHRPQGGMSAQNEWVAGPYRGYLLKVGWRGRHGAELVVMFRFPRQEDPGRIRERLRRLPSLTALPGWSRNSGASVVVEASSLLWRSSFHWRRPQTERIQGWVERLAQALSEQVAPFDGRCEECHSSGANQPVLIEEVPAYLCAACQERLVAEGAAAERRYEQMEANYALGALYGGLAAAVGGGCWALLGIVTGWVFAFVALGIAWLVAWAYHRGAGKIDGRGRVIAASLAVAGVVFGEVLYYAYAVHQVSPSTPFRLDAGWHALLRVLRERPGQIAVPLAFGLVGALYVLHRLGRPRFQPHIERPFPHAPR
jgi:hypothetical protein